MLNPINCDMCKIGVMAEIEFKEPLYFAEGPQVVPGIVTMECNNCGAIHTPAELLEQNRLQILKVRGALK